MTANNCPNGAGDTSLDGWRLYLSLQLYVIGRRAEFARAAACLSATPGGRAREPLLRVKAAVDGGGGGESTHRIAKWRQVSLVIATRSLLASQRVFCASRHLQSGPNLPGPQRCARARARARCRALSVIVELMSGRGSGRN